MKRLKAMGESPCLLRGSLPLRLIQIVEAVEKVSSRIFGRDAEKSDLIECATINDLMLARVSDPRKRPINRTEGVFLLAR